MLLTPDKTARKKPTRCPTGQKATPKEIMALRSEPQRQERVNKINECVNKSWRKSSPTSASTMTPHWRTGHVEQEIPEVMEGLGAPEAMWWRL